MSEIKTEIKENDDGSYIVTDAHSTADIVRWLLTQDDKETILRLLLAPPQRKWVELTDKEIKKIAKKHRWLESNVVLHLIPVFKSLEAKLEDKNK